MIDRELMQQALNALTTAELEGNCEYGVTDALRARLAQKEPEPVAQIQVAEDYHAHVVWLDGVDPVALDQRYLYTAPPQREWQGLTDENEIKHCWYEACQTDLELTSQLVVYFARAIEAKLKEKNAA